MLDLLDQIPAFARWSATRRFERVTAAARPGHIRFVRLHRKLGAIYFAYEPPFQRGDWLTDWEDLGDRPSGLSIAPALYAGWCTPSHAFYKARTDPPIAVWLLCNDQQGRGIVHVV
jgi:hypothetical protein